MRLRDSSLRTGSALVRIAAGDRRENRGLLFLVRGASDAEPLTIVERVCRTLIEEHSWKGFEWFAVPDQNALVDVDPRLEAVGLTRLEAGEFSGWSEHRVRRVLEPTLALLAAGRADDLFPSAGGAVGGLARGVQFLGREAELAELRDAVRAGRSFLVLAPRRSGKTSLLRRLEEDLASDCAVVFLDLQRHPSPEDLAASALAQATASSTRVAAERVERDGWAAVLREALVRTADRRPLVLILDELVYLLQFLRSKPDEAAYRREVGAILRELSGLRDDPGAVLLVAGSRDLADYLREEVGLPTAKLPLVTDLERFRLLPLGERADDPNLDRVLLGSGLVPEDGDEAWLRENFDLALPWVGLRFLDALFARLGSVERLDPAGLDAELVSFLRDSEVFRETDRQLVEGLREPAARSAVITAVDRLCSQPARAVTSAEDLRALLAAAAPKESERLLAWMIDHLPVRAEAGEVAIASRLFHRWWGLR